MQRMQQDTGDVDIHLTQQKARNRVVNFLQSYVCRADAVQTKS